MNDKGGTNIYAGNQPTHVHIFAFPAETGQRFWLGFELGFGLAAGAFLFFFSVAFLIALITAIAIRIAGP